MEPGPITRQDLALAGNLGADVLATSTVMIHQVPAVSIEDRTIVILRDDEPDEDGVQGWLLLDTEMGSHDWTTEQLRAWVTELADDPGMANYQPDRDLWATVLAIVERAEQQHQPQPEGTPS